MEKRNYTLVFSETEIQEKVQELGRIISEKITEETVVIVVMDGAFVFAADLLREITHNCKIHFLSASSYLESTHPVQHVELGNFGKIPPNRHYLILDDIFDTGNTIKEIQEQLKMHHPLSIQTCVLFCKHPNRSICNVLDYIGFSIGDGFLFGYGMDYKGRERNCPYVGKLIPENASRYYPTEKLLEELQEDSESKEVRDIISLDE